MELKTDLPKPGRARLLCTVGKRTRGGATDERDLTDSVRDFGSMPSAQTAMGARATPYCASNRLQRRTGASSAIAAFTSDYPFETAELMRRGAATFSCPVRRFAPSNCFGRRAAEFPFAAFSPTYETRTGSCRACLRRAQQPGDR